MLLDAAMLRSIFDADFLLLPSIFIFFADFRFS